MELFKNFKEVQTYVRNTYYQNPMYSIDTACDIDQEFRNLMIRWYVWYQGYDQDFHDYTLYTGKKRIKKQRNSMKMGKKICEDKADLIVNEKYKIIMSDDKSQEVIDGLLCNHRSRANNLVEWTNALGTGAFVEFAKSGQVMIDYVKGHNVIPISISNGIVESCAFAYPYKEGNQEIVYLNAHIRVRPLPENATDEAKQMRIDKGIPLDYDGYYIENMDIIKNHTPSQGEDKYKVMGDIGFALTNSTIPFFQIIKPAKANNFCLNENGLGVSAFSNAIDNLKSVDTVFDSYVNEFQLGRKRIFVHDSLAQIEVDEGDGKKVMHSRFDTEEGTFIGLDMSDKGGVSEMIKEIDMTLRVEDHEKGMNQMLNALAMKCGLGNGFYKFEGGQVKTATEVISENNPLYKSVKKDQHIMREATIGMTRALIVLYNALNNTTLDETQDVTVQFDDSIFIDTETVRKNKMLEFSAGLIDRVQYFIDAYGMTKEQAVKLVSDMEKREPSEESVVDDE